MKIFIISIILTFFSYISIDAETIESFVIDTSPLNIRSEPNNNSKIIGVLEHNQIITIIENTDMFSKIDNIVAPWIKIKKDDGNTGYIFGGFIRKVNFDNNRPIDLKIFQIVLKDKNYKGLIINNKVNIYEFPSYKSKIIMKFNPGTKIDILKQTYTDDSLSKNIFWFLIKKDGKEGFVPSNNISYNIHEINSYIYGVNEFPIKLIDPDQRRFIETNSEIIVFSKKKNVVIQRFSLQENSDTLKIINNNLFNKIFNKNIIIINHNWNHFTCCPIGYSGNIIFSIDNDGKLSNKLFSWFNYIGAQNEPSASLQDISISNKNVIIIYNYNEISGLPSLGNGTLKVIFNVSKNIIHFNNIESNVIKTYDFINGSFSTNDEYKLKEPVIIQFNKESINKKFLYISKLYHFIF